MRALPETPHRQNFTASGRRRRGHREATCRRGDLPELLAPRNRRGAARSHRGDARRRVRRARPAARCASSPSAGCDADAATSLARAGAGHSEYGGHAADRRSARQRSGRDAALRAHRCRVLSATRRCGACACSRGRAAGIRAVRRAGTSDAGGRSARRARSNRSCPDSSAPVPR